MSEAQESQVVSTGDRAVEVSITSTDPRFVSTTFAVDGERIEIWFRASVPLFVERSDAVVPLGLLAAMRGRCPLVVPGRVSPRLLANSDQAQDILTAFSDGLHPTTIVADAERAAGSPGRGVGAFFSCGLDSFFTALKHQDQISHLVFVRGFDIIEIESKRGAAALDSARRAAEALGKQLIEIDTNLRDLTERFAPWSLAHGPALGTVALLLQAQLRRVFVASTDTYRHLWPRGSHPLLDPLWGTEILEVVHDGAEANRPQKLAVVARSEVAMRHLRVCTNQSASYNCGRCGRCVRMMVNLRLLDASERCVTFPDALELRLVARMHLADHVRAIVRDSLNLAVDRRDWSLALALTIALRPHPLLAIRHRLGDLRRRRRRRATPLR
ncbi:MAG: hypothetical protein QOG43_529 [Actinomycetota bacterium]|nr:hypothetical protein [Actinomycetota bacterium]